MTSRPENETDNWPFARPRVEGVREQYQRVEFFHRLANESCEPVAKFRLLLAAIYSARAVVELMLEAADKQEWVPTRDDLKKHLPSQIPWYDLIERIRIHDFHRFGLVPPNPNIRGFFLGGPIKLRAQRGAAVYSVPATGPEMRMTGHSTIEEQRPLLVDDGRFFDDARRQWVELDRIVRDFIAGAKETINQFENVLDQPRGSA